jgi:hypothetical protein
VGWFGGWLLWARELVLGWPCWGLFGQNSGEEVGRRRAVMLQGSGWAKSRCGLSTGEWDFTLMIMMKTDEME